MSQRKDLGLTLIGSMIYGHLRSASIEIDVLLSRNGETVKESLSPLEKLYFETLKQTLEERIEQLGNIFTDIPLPKKLPDGDHKD